MNAVLRAALEYRERSWNPLPVLADKTPAFDLLEATRGTRRWGQLRDEPADTKEIEHWYELDPGASVAVILEPGHDVIDVDDLDADGAPELPRTPTASTPRPGRHYHVRSSSPVRARTFEWGELLVGGVCVMPPTAGYRWLVKPEEVELAELPEQLREIARESKPRSARRDLESLGVPWFSRESLVRADTREDVAARLLVALGGPEDVVLGKTFRCLLHDDLRPSAELYRVADESILYHCWARCCGLDRSGWLPLAAVRARQAGRQGRLGRVELAVWKIDLLERAGLVALPDLAGPEAPEHLRLVWEGLLRLLALRWLTSPGQPTPFARKFAAPWCGLTEHEVRVGFDELRRLGFVRYAGCDPRGLSLWLPKGVRPIA